MKRVNVILLGLLCVMVPGKIMPWFDGSGQGGLDSAWSLTGGRAQASPAQNVAYEDHNYGVEVANISSRKKKSFKVDVTVTSTVPVNVEMKDDRLVVQQQSRGGFLGGDVVSVDLKEIGKRCAHAYKVPTWPVHIACFEDKDRLDVRFKYEYATNGFSSSGHTRDLSELIFGQGSMYVRDVLLASKLVEQGQVTDWSDGAGTNGYLDDVAGQRLSWAAKSHEYRFDFAYTRHFVNNHIALGFNIPFVFRKHTLKACCNSCGEDTGFNSADFKAKYDSCSCTAFIKDFLLAKKICWNENDTEKGLGDVEAFLNVEIKTHDIEKWLVGLRVLFPTAKERNINKLWGPELGNGGFSEISLFTSMLFSEHQLFNPHFFLQVTASLPADVTRRIPSHKKYKYAANTDGVLASLLALGELVRSKVTTDFDMVDTTFRRFATESERIKIRRGPEMIFQVGNVFEDIGCKKFFADIYYRLRLKGSDYLNCRVLSCCGLGDCFEPAILKHNTFQAEHLLGLNFNYLFDCGWRGGLGIAYTVAGRNIPKTFQVGLSVSGEF